MSTGKTFDDLASGGGDWLFRQEGLVLGPVPAKKLVEMLFAGEVDARTEVAPMGSSEFRPMAQVDGFRVHCAKAEAKRRVEVSDAQDRARSAKQRNVKAAVIGGAGLALLGATAAGAWFLATHTGEDDLEAYALANITVEPPQIWGASQNAEDDELVDYPGSNPPPKKPVAVAAAAPNAPGPAASPSAPVPTQPASASAAPPKPTRRAPSQPSSKGLSAASSDPDGMQTAQFDQSAINAVVARHQKGLFSCFKQEAEREPGFGGRIPLEFVIGNDGKVAKLWVDNPRYKNGPMYDCLLAELQRWPFKAYEGERATVGLSFNIGKR